MLYIVSTPIGNLEDITLRAISALNNSDIILAEDTRVTRVLLSRYGIDKPMISYHQHSKIARVSEIIERLKEDKTISLASDAGPNAALTALSISGFPADKFVFLGFPSHKKGRQAFFKKIGDIEETVVFYESKRRILKALGELKEF